MCSVATMNSLYRHSTETCIRLHEMFLECFFCKFFVTILPNQCCSRGQMAYQVIEAVEFKSESHFPSRSSLGASGAPFQQQYSTSEPTQPKQGTQTSSFYEVTLVVSFLLWYTTFLGLDKGRKSTADIRCIQCHVKYMRLDAPKISC